MSGVKNMRLTAKGFRWKTKDKREMSLSEMDYTHLRNTIRWIQTKIANEDYNFWSMSYVTPGEKADFIDGSEAIAKAAETYWNKVIALMQAELKKRDGDVPEYYAF